MKWAFLCLSFLCSVPIFAESKNVYLHLKTGQVISCSISSDPKITYGANYVRLTSTALDLEYQISEVDRLSFSPGSSDIKEVSANEGEMKNIEGQLTFRGYAPESIVQVISVSGKAIATGATDTEGSLCIDLSSYPQGVYLINANGSTYKIVKK